MTENIPGPAEHDNQADQIPDEGPPPADDDAESDRPSSVEPPA